MERRAAARELVDDRLVDGRDRVAHQRVRAGHGREAAHAAGVRAGVAVADPLEVARGRERDRALAVAQREQRELVAVEELLDHDRDVAEPALDQHLVQRRPRLRLRGGDRDALARRQTVGLDHRRVAGDRGHARLDVAHDLVRRRGDAGGGHDLLGVRLRALEPGGGGDRAEAADAGGVQRVGEPGDERRLGPDDDEVDPGVARRGRERGGIVRGRVERPRVAADARVAGGAQHLRRLRGAQQRPDDRVLATAGADDQDPHTAPMKSSIGIAESDS